MTIDDLIKQLQHIRDREGNLNAYIWDDGIAKSPDRVIKRETVNGDKKGCFIEL